MAGNLRQREYCHLGFRGGAVFAVAIGLFIQLAVVFVAPDVSDAQVPPPLPCPADETSRDSVIYGDANWSYSYLASEGTSYAVAIDTIVSLGNTDSGCPNEWEHASPAAPNADIVEHLGAAITVPNMSPPERGAFWFPEYHDGKLLVSHFSACANNPLPDVIDGVRSGCQTASQSIGQFAVERSEYTTLHIRAAAGDAGGSLSASNSAGSVLDIEVNPRNGRLYYLGDPNFIGYFPAVADPAGGTTWDLSAGRHFARSQVNHWTQNCQKWSGISACGGIAIGNELTILPTDDIAVTDWVRGKVLIFDKDANFLDEAPTPKSWVNINGNTGHLLQPLSIEGSPICARQRQDGSCAAGRFVVNFDVFGGRDTHPFQEYVFDRGDPGNSGVAPSITRMSPDPVVIKAHVLRSPDYYQPGSDYYEWLDGTKHCYDTAWGPVYGCAASVRGVKYDSDGSLWVGAFDARNPGAFSQYQPSEVMVFVPKTDSGALGGQRFPWNSASAPGPATGNTECDFRSPAPFNSGSYLVCRAESVGGSKTRFLSSGRYVDSFVQVGADMYWGGWAGSFEGVIRTNPGAWPPVFEEVPGQPDYARPGSVWRSDKLRGDPCRHSSRFGPAPWPDAYRTVECEWKNRKIPGTSPPGTSRDNSEHIGALRTPDNLQRALFDRHGDLVDQQVHLVYDPDRSAVWTTVQSMLRCGKTLGWKNGLQCPDASSKLPSGYSPPRSDPFVLPQWIVRHNVYPRAPKILNPTGSVAASENESVWVGADVYSTVRPSITVEVRDSSGSVRTLSAIDVELIPPSGDSGPYKVKAKIDLTAGDPRVGYRISASNAAGSDVAPANEGGSPAYFDVVAATSTSTEWHFAEGYVGPGWQEYLVVANSTGEKASVDVVLRPDAPGLSPCTINRLVQPSGRKTFNVRDELASSSADLNCGAIHDKIQNGDGVGLGASVISANGVPVVAERPLYFNSEMNLGWISGLAGQMAVSGASNAMGATSASSTWHFAEGYFRATPGETSDNWSVFLTLANPGASDTTAQISLLPNSPAKPRLRKDVVIKAGRRLTLPVTEELLNPSRGGVSGFYDPGIPANQRPPNGASYPDSTEFGIEVVSASPIVAERPVYFVSKILGAPEIRGGDVAIGAVGPRRRWAFAEGAAGQSFSTFLTLANPGSSAASVIVTYLRGAASPVSKTYQLGQRERRTLTVNEELASLIAGTQSADVGFDVRSTVPIVVERPAYFRGTLGINTQDQVHGGHVAFGTTAARTEWNFAEGYRPSSGCDGCNQCKKTDPIPNNMIEYLTLANPGPGDATVQVDFLPDTTKTAPSRSQFDVPAGARKTVATFDQLYGDKWCGVGFGMRVKSIQKQGNSAAQPIIAERPIYWNHTIGGIDVNAGHVVLPVHNLGIAADPALGIPFPIYDLSADYSGIDVDSLAVPRAPIAITSLTGDITATVGQQLVVEARTEGDPDAVTLHASPDPVELTGTVSASNDYRMEKIGSNQFRVVIEASTSALLQAVARTGTSIAVSRSSYIKVVRSGIAGRVVAEGSDPLRAEPVQGVTINALDSSGQVASTQSSSSGYYYLAVAPGEYRLAFLPNNVAGTQPAFGDRYSNHSNSWEDWSAVSVPSSGTYYDEQLPQAGRISGTVYGAAESTISFANSRVAFSSTRDGDEEIYVMATDGSSQTRLTGSPGADTWPSFSLDGSKIAFVSARDGSEEIYVANPDGTNQVRLTSNLARDYAPSISPDGTKIAFVSDRTGSPQVHLMASDGTDQVAVPGSGESEAQPTFSPDGGRIAYVSGFDIYSIRLDGTDKVRVTTGGNNYLPSYSPDGSRISFTSVRDGNEEIYSISTDGLDARRLTSNPAIDAASAFSPDGTKLVFASNRDSGPGAMDLYEMEWPTGASQQRVTYGAQVSSPPSLGAGNSSAPTTLADVSVTFYDVESRKPIGRSASTDPQGRYELWLVPGSYFGLVNSSTEAKPLGWNGYSPVWSKGQLFDSANGGNLTALTIGNPDTWVAYDEVLPRLFLVSGRVVPVGGPGLGADGRIGSYRAIAPNGQYWGLELPQDGNYTYPLPNGAWKIAFVIPGYQISYYHNTIDFESASVITVAGAPVTVADQEVRPPV